MTPLNLHHLSMYSCKAVLPRHQIPGEVTRSLGECQYQDRDNEPFSENREKVLSDAKQNIVLAH